MKRLSLRRVLRLARSTLSMLAAVAWMTAAGACGDAGDDGDGAVAPGPVGGGTSPPPWPMTVDNQVQLLAPCGGPSLTFFQGVTPVDVPSGATQLVDIPQLFGAYEIGFQVNGWYWRCGGASDCPNPKSCQNPDNAGQVAIRVTPSNTPPGCTAAELVPNFDAFTCDASVPNASDVVSVTLEDPGTCLVRVEAAGLSSLDPTAGCCDCNTCTTIPAGQQTRCT